ncbi:MAG: hypothetical protein JNK67_32530, partial [Alphaproteobacteria bacterium]|nr:hypothetical protein [Alphaproteobacteria bacterium]
AAALFTASDPDGNPITAYEFRDNGSGGGQFRLGGVAQAAGTAFDVSAASLGSLVYAGGSAAGSETIDVRASDGALWSGWTTVSVATLQANRAPSIVAATGASVATGAAITAAALFTASDPDGNPITAYEFRDNGSGGGQFRLGGVAQAAGTAFGVSAASLGALVYAGGAAAGSETIDVRASDGVLWSGWTTVSVATLQANRAPTIVAGSTTTLPAGSGVAASSLFTASDPDGTAIVSYELRDNDAGGGTLQLAGVVLPAGTVVTVSAANLGNLVYVAGTTGGTETIDVRASDGSLWSSWLSLPLTTQVQSEGTTTPVIAAATSSIATNQWVLASTLFTASDPQGDAIARYRFTDLSGGNGYLWYGGATIAAGTSLEVASSQISGVWFRGAASGPATDQLRVEAFDGTGWGSRDLTITTMQPNRAPSVVATSGVRITAGSAIAVTALFSVSDADGDAITAYELWDSAGAGVFRVGGVAQPSGSAISISPAQLAGTDYLGASAAASESVWVRAKDATTWSSWTTITAQTVEGAGGPPKLADLLAASGGSVLSGCGCSACMLQGLFSGASANAGATAASVQSPVYMGDDQSSTAALFAPAR